MDVTDVGQGETGEAGNAPAAPTSFMAAVADRRKTTFSLTWIAPATAAGGQVSGYQVRAAKVPITAANFDDPTVTIVVPDAMTPAPVGQPDGVVTQPLYIQVGYYFAVAALDGGGRRSGIVPTNTPVAAQFNVAAIAAPGTNEQFGRSVSADGDLDGDGLSDLVVGTLNAGKAYLYLGKAGFAPTAPSVVFSGAQPGFGFTVAQIGDIDHDNREDLAIADPLEDDKIYIYKGRATWPATLTDAQADYTISTDASYAGSLFGFSISRLGDFTGDDGIDDVAISARGFGASIGRVAIVRGKTTGFASVSLPDTTNAIVIDADDTLGKSLFGYRVLGLGHFYTTTPGTTLVMSAVGSTTVTTANMGHIYAFHGQTGTAGAIAISAADNSLSGPAPGARIGIVLSSLGKMLDGFPGLGVGNLVDTIDIPGGHGGSYLMSGTPTTGPMANNHVAYVADQNANGGIQIGGGVAGRDMNLSLIGDGTPDLVYAGEIGNFFTISDGAKLGAKASPLELGSTAEVTVTLPAGWQTGEGTTSIIPDVNGDGLPDFCIGSQLQPGGVLVYY
jgi:hypothetical protein